MRRILEPWIPKDEALGAEGASVLRVAAALRRRKGIFGLRKLGCPFPTLRVVRQRGPTRRAMNREIIRARLQIRVPVNGKGHSESSSSPEPDASSRRRRFDCSFGGRLICDMGFNWCGRHRGHTRLNADSGRQALAAARNVAGRYFAVSFQSPATTENASRGPVERSRQSVSSASREQR
jgi:hypothetical protein